MDRVLDGVEFNSLITQLAAVFTKYGVPKVISTEMPPPTVVLVRMINDRLVHTGKNRYARYLTGSTLEGMLAVTSHDFLDFLNIELRLGHKSEQKAPMVDIGLTLDNLHRIAIECHDLTQPTGPRYNEMLNAAQGMVIQTLVLAGVVLPNNYGKPVRWHERCLELGYTDRT